METVLKTDPDLLREVISARSGEAFKELVERYLGLVHAAARRQVGPDLAEDVTQAVFLLLWQRAAHVRSPAFLAGWLVNATRLTALQARRSERRRIHRETVASANRSLITEGAVTQSSGGLSPIIDQALGRLREAERSAIALRYLQDKSVAEIAAAFGISEPAAAKRISRGLERLRKEFARRGISMAITALGVAIAEQSHLTAPSAALAQQIVQSVATGGHSAASILAAGVTTAMKMKTLSTAVLMLILILAATGGGWYGLHWLNSAASPSVASDTIAPPPVAIAPEPSSTLPDTDALGPIKVGVVVSLFNSTQKEPSGKLFGFDKCSRVAKDLHAANMDVRPIIEPGSESSVPQTHALETYFPQRDAIDASDQAELKKLDVIVAVEVWIPDPKLVASLQDVVSGGVAMLNGDGIGGNAALSGISEARWGQTDAPVPCQVIADHPILTGFHIGQALRLRPLGEFGPLPADAIPLIKVNDMAGITNANSDPMRKPWFYPVYISSLGKGKLVCYQYAAFGNPSPELHDANRAKFIRHCVRWLANRPVGN